MECALQEPPAFVRCGLRSEAMACPTNEVHVWRASLVSRPDRHLLWQVLSEEERSRAGRFVFDRDREHFVVARGLLRRLLGRYLDRDPASIEFRYSAFGKPELSGALAAEGFRFNLSHSGGLALYALAREREIGVDIEQFRDNLDEMEIAERFFSRAEVAALRALPPSAENKGFFTCWTRKEAYIKAKGEGLSTPLDRFDVSLAPGQPARLLMTREAPEERERWSLREIDPGPGYTAAIAVEGHDWKLRLWRESPAVTDEE